jgi:hypothetical protein
MPVNTPADSPYESFSNKWAYIPSGNRAGQSHVMPLNDLQDHILSPKCWCCPVEDPHVFDMWNHTSADGREKYENGEKLRS